jgi:hypothetical protein
VRVLAADPKRGTERHAGLAADMAGKLTMRLPFGGLAGLRSTGDPDQAGAAPFGFSEAA